MKNGSAINRIENFMTIAIVYASFLIIYFIGLFLNIEKLCTFGVISSGTATGAFIMLAFLNRKKIVSSISLFILILSSFISVFAFVIADGLSRDKLILTILGSLSVLFFFISMHALKGTTYVNSEIIDVPKNYKLLRFTFLTVLIVLVTSIALIVLDIIPIQGNYTVYIVIILQILLLIGLYMLLKRKK